MSDVFVVREEESQGSEYWNLYFIYRLNIWFKVFLDRNWNIESDVWDFKK